MLLAFDISTSVIGFSAFDDHGHLLEMDFVSFNSKDSLFIRLEQFKEKIRHYEFAKRGIKFVCTKPISNSHKNGDSKNGFKNFPANCIFISIHKVGECINVNKNETAI